MTIATEEIPTVLPWVKKTTGLLESGGRKHLRYIKEHRPVSYTGFLLDGKLSAHLAEIDARSTEMYDLLMQQKVQKEGINEQLKAKKRWRINPGHAL